MKNKKQKTSGQKKEEESEKETQQTDRTVEHDGQALIETRQTKTRHSPIASPSASPEALPDRLTSSFAEKRC